MLPISLFFQGRKKAMKILKSMLAERKAAPEKRHGDFFDYVVDELKKERTMLTEAIALDLMFVLIFASYETTSLATTLAIRFLTDHPLVLGKLTVSSWIPNWREFKVHDFHAHFISFFVSSGRA